MKYLVNRETKEHRLYTEGDYNRLGHVHGKWDVVEADEEGWITWEGGECPLPDGHKYNFATKNYPSRYINDVYAQPENNEWESGSSHRVTAYRPILSTAEKEEPRRHGRTIVYIPESQQSVFDRLKSAIAASESIPAIIAEIDALLPEGYCVTRCDVTPAGEPVEQPAEDMSDWRNWREGDLVTYSGDTIAYHWWTKGRKYPIRNTAQGLEVIADDGDAYTIDGWRLAATARFLFHSRPAKVTE